MVVAQHLGQLLNGGIAQLFCECRADDAGEVGLGSDTLHDGGVGGYDDVVLVHAP